MSMILTPEGWSTPTGHELRSCPTCHELMEVRKAATADTSCIFCMLAEMQRAVRKVLTLPRRLLEQVERPGWLRDRCGRTTRLRLIAAIENEKVAMAAAGGRLS